MNEEKKPWKWRIHATSEDNGFDVIGTISDEDSGHLSLEFIEAVKRHIAQKTLLTKQTREFPRGKSP